MTVGVVVFAFAMTANLAFAGKSNDRHCYPVKDDCCPSLTVANNIKANVNNKVITVSSTGLNVTSGNGQSSKFGKHGQSSNAGLITTSAAQAVADVQTGANDTNINVTTPVKGAVNVSNNNNAGVNNFVVTVANTGLNKSSNGNISTGYAGSSASVVTVVNATVIKVK